VEVGVAEGVDARVEEGAGAGVETGVGLGGAGLDAATTTGGTALELAPDAGAERPPPATVTEELSAGRRGLAGGSAGGGAFCEAAVWVAVSPAL